MKSALLWPFLLIAPVRADHQEKRLYKNLMADYERLERPVRNSSSAVTTYLGVILQQLIDVDEKNQIITVNCWLKYTWRDYNLQWNPEDYGGVSNVRFPYGTLWKPDVLLYNSVSSDFDSTYPTNMVAYNDGTINWIPPGIFQISCKIDITYFPFDEQHCYFKFGSWTYDGTKLDLQPDEKGFDMTEYITNGEWSLVSATVHRHEKFYDCCPEPYPDLKFMMHMKRRTVYFAFNLVMPCMLITWLTIIGFTLPPDAGEKVGLQVTVLLAICFFLNIVAEMSPPTSEAVPLLGVFFTCCMFVCTISCVFTVFILNLHHRNSESHSMGPLTRTLFLYWVPWLLVMKRPGSSLEWKHLPPLFPPKKLVSLDEETKHKPSPISQHQDRDVERRINQCFMALVKSQELSGAQQSKLLMLQGIFREIKFITQRMADEDEENYVKNEWKFMAMVVDRLCMIILAICLCASVVYISFKAPYLLA